MPFSYKPDLEYVFKESTRLVGLIEDLLDQDSICDCHDLTVALLTEIDQTFRDIRDGANDNRDVVPREYLFIFRDNIRISVELISLILDSNPCEDVYIICEIANLIRTIYTFACEINTHLAYILYTLLPDGNNCGCKTATLRFTAGDNDYIYDAIKHIDEAEKYSDLLFKILLKDGKPEDCYDDSGLYEKIIYNLREAHDSVDKFYKSYELDNYYCGACIYTMLVQLAHNILNATIYIYEDLYENDYDFCNNLDSRSTLSMYCYAPLKSTLRQVLKVYVDDDLQ